MKPAYFCEKTGIRIIAPGMSKDVDPVNGHETCTEDPPQLTRISVDEHQRIVDEVIAKTRKAYESQLNARAKQYVVELEELNERHLAEVESLRSAHAAELEELTRPLDTTPTQGGKKHR